MVAMREYRTIAPQDLMLGEKIGEGQFGDVHNGFLYPKVHSRHLLQTKAGLYFIAFVCFLLMFGLWGYLVGGILFPSLALINEVTVSLFRVVYCLDTVLSIGISNADIQCSIGPIYTAGGISGMLVAQYISTSGIFMFFPSRVLAGMSLSLSWKGMLLNWWI